MSKKHLGATIDLHSGGVDLLFPHHENEIAQSQCCNGATFARHWYHSEFLLVDGKKMSKSLGNLYTLSDLTAKGFSPMAIRYALLEGHPRKQLNFTLNSLHAGEQAIQKFRRFRDTLRQPSIHQTPPQRALFEDAIDALKDDLWLPWAIGAIHQIIDNYLPSYHDAAADLVSFEQIMSVLGFDLDREVEIPLAVKELAERRWAAKKAKDYATADALRKELAAAGWSMLDGKEGYKLEPVKK